MSARYGWRPYETAVLRLLLGLGLALRFGTLLEGAGVWRTSFAWLGLAAAAGLALGFATPLAGIACAAAALGVAIAGAPDLVAVGTVAALVGVIGSGGALAGGVIAVFALAALAPLAGVAPSGLALLAALFFIADRRLFAERAPGTVDVIFYDGGCALCHGMVKLLLRADADGERFSYAPLDGALFRGLIDATARASLADSVVVRTADGAVLERSAAALWIAARLGGLYRAASVFASALPRAWRDRAYDALAGARFRIFGRTSGDDACPVLAPELRARFDLRGARE